ncbi:toll/interleukin-1 receptor-like protein [Neltuma alba]|uniref:toll/interleukin-1 receptor-like protein n=1 Tax=Neltuma alba TaxID=207710 RepID=UPI0010A328FD|nr:toll/interleukin-1 receptor-like protein [Prosopis alba]
MALARPDTGAPGPSSPSTSPKYDVFLSFRGEDVRYGFAAHLCSALDRQGIYTFRDDEHLERGELISDQLRQAIVQSEIAIVVLTENYFSSRWCLEELVTIVDSRDDRGQIVVPVFYGIDPSDVRHQRRSIAAAFEEHEARCSVDTIRRWREASTKISYLRGWVAEIVG